MQRQLPKCWNRSCLSSHYKIAPFSFIRETNQSYVRVLGIFNLPLSEERSKKPSRPTSYSGSRLAYYPYQTSCGINYIDYTLRLCLSPPPRKTKGERKKETKSIEWWHFPLAPSCCDIQVHDNRWGKLVWWINGLITGQVVNLMETKPSLPTPVVNSMVIDKGVHPLS